MSPTTLAPNYTLRWKSVTFVRETPPPPTTRRKRLKLVSPDAVAALAFELIPDDAREHFVACYLDSQNGLVASHEVSVGSLAASIVHPREVLGPALRLMGVASLILIHNHPSGDCTPSKEDTQLTSQLAEGARLLGLRIHDHVIIGHQERRHVSLAQRGLL